MQTATQYLVRQVIAASQQNNSAASQAVTGDAEEAGYCLDAPDCLPAGFMKTTTISAGTVVYPAMMDRAALILDEPISRMRTDSVSPLDLVVGDYVIQHGALFCVEHITRRDDHGSTVAACLSRLIGKDSGAIPRAYLDTPEQMARAGYKLASKLPDGLYWNVQGNDLARVPKVRK
jgi:hypothetical protein